MQLPPEYMCINSVCRLKNDDWKKYVKKQIRVNVSDQIRLNLNKITSANSYFNASVCKGVRNALYWSGTKRYEILL